MAPAHVDSLLVAGMVGLLSALPFSVGLLLWRNDVSAELMGPVLIAFVWGLLLASRPYGSPIRAWVQFLTTADTSQFWWIESLTCLLTVVLPPAGVAFVAHFARLIIAETHGE